MVWPEVCLRAPANVPGQGGEDVRSLVDIERRNEWLRWVLVAGAIGLSVNVPWAAYAQPAAPAIGRATIECGSGDGKRSTCVADTSAGVVLVHQAGEASCVLGRTWGYDTKGVWVADGCRGTFAFTDDRPTISCAASATGERVERKADTTGGVAIASASPACVLGKTWGYDDEGVWVAEGCSASFVLTTRPGLACGSDTPGRQQCAADTSAGVVLARTTGTSSCVLGESWGYDAAGVWTDRSCRGEFVLGHTAGAAATQDRDLDAYFGNFEPYGRLLAHVAAYDDQLEVQDNASWVGLKFSTRGPVKFFAATEWGVNLVRGGTQFNPGASTDSGFFTIDAAQRDQVFGARLGYVGVDFGYGGKVTIGKQWGVHTDVTMYTTDQFNVFGSEASATYTGDTDGGLLGTGRADQAVSYHVDLLEILNLGGQVQFRTTENDDVIDGAGVSAQLTILPSTKIGASYTKTNFDDLTKSLVRGLGGDAEIAAVGARLDWKVLQAGLVYSRQRNADLTSVLVRTIPGGDPDVESIVFDADGVEGFARLNFPGFAVYGGFNNYTPDVDDALLNPDFRVRYAIAGGEFHLAETTYLYAEARLFDDSVGSMGEEGFNVLTVGLHYGFSFKGFHRR